MLPCETPEVDWGSLFDKVVFIRTACYREVKSLRLRLKRLTEFGAVKSVCCCLGFHYPQFWVSRVWLQLFPGNHNYNKIFGSDWLSIALISA